MTSLDRLRQAMSPSEKGRSPVLSSEAIKASLGQYGVSAADQLLSSSGFEVETNSGAPGLDVITNPEILAEFEKDLTAYEQIFAGANITMPTTEELADGGIDWARLAELKEQHPGYELVCTPLVADITTMRSIAFAVTNNQNIPNNPPKKYPQAKTASDGLWIAGTVIENWSDNMAATTRDYLASGIPTASLNNGEIWTAYLMPSQDKPDNLNMSYQQMKQKGLTTTTIPGYIAYQMKRIQQGQKPIDVGIYTWALGEFTNSSGDVCAPFVDWGPDSGRVRVDWFRVDESFDDLGVRSPVG